MGSRTLIRILVRGAILIFLGALMSFVSAAYLVGAKPGRMGMVPLSEVVKGCPSWLKRTDYFLFAYLGLVLLWLALRAPETFHWRKVELPAVAGFVIFSAFSMAFYVSSFSMLFGKLFGPEDVRVLVDCSDSRCSAQ